MESVRTELQAGSIFLSPKAIQRVFNIRQGLCLKRDNITVFLMPEVDEDGAVLEINVV